MDIDEDLLRKWQELSILVLTKAAEVKTRHPEISDSIRLGLAQFLDQPPPGTEQQMEERIAECSRLLVDWRMQARGI